MIIVRVFIVISLNTGNLQYAERALATELLRISQANVETSDYLIGAARLHVYRSQFLEARPYLERAIQIDHQVFCMLLSKISKHFTPISFV